MKHVRGNVNGLALDLVGPSTVVSDAPSNGANVSLGHGDGLSIIEGLDSSKNVQVLLHNVGKLHQHVRTRLRSNLLPYCLEGFSSRGDGYVDILFRGFANRRNDFLGGGIDDFKFLLVNALNPLVIDEAGGRMLVNSYSGRSFYSFSKTLSNAVVLLKLTGQSAADKYP